MTLPSRAALAQQRHEMATSLLAMREQMGPIYDTADGMRADLEARGWSPAAGEQAALVWLCSAIQSAMGDQQ